MKSLLATALTLAVICVSTSAYAQGESRVSTELKPKKRVSVELLGAQLILKGGGLGVGYAVTPKLQTEVNYAIYTLENDPEPSFFGSFYRVKNEFSAIGVRANFYPLASVDAGGWYIGGALAQVNLKTKTSSSFYGDGAADNAKFGAQGYTGYTFRGGLLRSASMLIRLGLGYGVGGGVQTRTTTASGTKTEIKDSGLLDLNIGMMF
ncbi:MAG: hypothetical protein AAB250_06755 [Bdellovibrionota bacterium]